MSRPVSASSASTRRSSIWMRASRARIVGRSLRIGATWESEQDGSHDQQAMRHTFTLERWLSRGVTHQSTLGRVGRARVANGRVRSDESMILRIFRRAPAAARVSGQRSPVFASQKVTSCRSSELRAAVNPDARISDTPFDETWRPDLHTLIFMYRTRLPGVNDSLDTQPGTRGVSIAERAHVTK